MNLNHLYYFWTAAREGSISRAAEAVHLTQSTLSLQIKRLEKSLGAALLVRGRHGVSLSPAGKTAFEHAEKLFSSLESFTESLRHGTPPPAPPLRLGFYPSFSTSWLGKFILFLERAAPASPPRILTADAGTLQEMVSRKKIDMAVGVQDLSVGMGPDFRGKFLGKTPLFWVASPGTARKVRRFPEDLGKVPLLLRPPEDPVRKQVDHFLYSKKIQALVRAELTGAETLREMAATGWGAAVLDPLTAAEGLKRGRLVKLHERPVGIAQDMWLLYRRHHRDEPSRQKALDLLMEEFTLEE